MDDSFKQWWRYPVTAGAVIAAAVVYLFATPKGVDPLFLDARAFEGEPWRLMTTALVHGGTLQSDAAGPGALHLIFNCLWLFWLGAKLEAHFGHARYAGFIVLTAVASSAAEYAVHHTPVGLSGVVYAMVGLRWILNRRHPVFARTIPKRTFDFLAFWFLLCVALTYTDTMPIANVAHGVGALLGIMMGRAIVDHGAKRAAALAGIAVTTALTLTGAGWARHYVNFGSPSAPDLFQLAARDFEAGDIESARDRFSKITRYRHPLPEVFFNLALSEFRLGNTDAARPAIERAVTGYEAAIARAERDGEDRKALQTALERARALRAGLPSASAP